jgi:GTPase SAR1 family protein
MATPALSPAPSSAPVAIVCVGMAGSGKTTFMQRLVSHLYTHPDPTVREPAVPRPGTAAAPPYILNLDPAVHHVPFTPNIDIRDSVNYKEVMKQFNLGPNGGILTSLNLFSTKIDQVISLLEKRTAPPEPVAAPEQTTVEFMTNAAKTTPSVQSAQQVKHILVDTPGQIEVFVWSASGEILLSSLASTFPTVIAYVIDTPRTTSTSTFMSNMLYACSILYKTKLPMILVFNKTDVQNADFAKEWMTDFEAFQDALRKEEDSGEGSAVGGGSGYMGSLLNSMSLVLDEFYKHLSVVGVSAMTGEVSKTGSLARLRSCFECAPPSCASPSSRGDLLADTVSSRVLTSSSKASMQRGKNSSATTNPNSSAGVLSARRKRLLHANENSTS